MGANVDAAIRALFLKQEYQDGTYLVDTSQGFASLHVAPYEGGNRNANLVLYIDDSPDNTDPDLGCLMAHHPASCRVGSRADARRLIKIMCKKAGIEVPPALVLPYADGAELLLDPLAVAAFRTTVGSEP